MINMKIETKRLTQPAQPKLYRQIFDFSNLCVLCFILKRQPENAVLAQAIIFHCKKGIHYILNFLEEADIMVTKKKKKLNQIKESALFKLINLLINRKYLSISLAFAFILTTFFFFSESCGPAGQIGFLATGLNKVPNIGTILKTKPALTTNLKDAVTEVPFLDDYRPESFLPLRPIPLKGTLARFHSIPGNWYVNLKSYCLHAGSYAPGKGKGYLYAPLDGPRADIIRDVLHNSVQHPKIPQTGIQLLIWAILARTKISKMSPTEQAVAALLLTPRQIVKLNGGALGLIPESAFESAFGSLPSGIRQVVKAETTMRSILSSGIYTYKQLEHVAVLTGIAPHQKGDREVPAYRWCYHPDNYFVRYQPYGYPRTRVEISVPSPCTLKSDKLGRIYSVTDRHGNTLKVQYDDSIKPLVVAGSASPVGYVFRHVRFVHRNPKNNKKNYSKRWTGQGWTLISVPQKNSRDTKNMPKHYYADAEQKIAWARKHKVQVDSLSAQAPPTAFRNSVASKAVELGILTKSVQSFISTQSSSNKKSAKAASNLLKKTWQQLICLAMMKRPQRNRSGSAKPSLNFFGIAPSGPAETEESAFNPGYFSGASRSKDSGGGGFGFDLSGGSAVPGRQGEQRLGMGGPENLGVDINKYSDGYDEGWYAGYYEGFYDGINNNPYSDNLELVPLVPDPWQDGYIDGKENGYKDGYKDGKNF